MSDRAKQLSDLQFSLLRIAISPGMAARSPNMPLVAIRGYYGKALYRQNCLHADACLTNKDVIVCQEKENCLYKQLFKSADNHYVFRSQQHGAEVFSRSLPFTFELILAKQNPNRQEAIILALEAAKDDLFGANSIMIIECFAHSFDTKPKLIFDSEQDGNEQADKSFKIIKASNVMKASFTKTSYRLKINLISPLFLLDKRKKFIRQPSFEDIIYALIRRINLWASSQGIKTELDYLLEISKSARLLSKSLESIKTSRYSKSQKNQQWLGGLIGHLSFENVNSEIIPFLKLAEYLHLGKDTAFGQGQIKISWY